jgi:hypothetical protein
MATLTITITTGVIIMAKPSVSKKPHKLNLTRCQISVFHEVIDLTDQMSVFLNRLYPQKLIPADIKQATDLVRACPI